jgi:hypothetical protein
MKLGWSVLVIAPMIALTGPPVAIRWLRVNPSAVVADWPGRQFLLIQFMELALYVVYDPQGRARVCGRLCSLCRGYCRGVKTGGDERVGQLGGNNLEALTKIGSPCFNPITSGAIARSAIVPSLDSPLARCLVAPLTSLATAALRL